MNASVRLLRDDEFDAWFDRAKTGYADNIERDAGFTRERAQQKAERDMTQLFPERRVPDGHAIFIIEDGGGAVGRLWVAEREDGGERVLFVYDVEVDGPMRGRGYGKLAMRFAEEEARRRGLPRVALNVFGGNDVARGLYRSLGFREVAVWMTKEV